MGKKENINTLSKVKKDGKKSGNVFKVDGKFDFIALVKNIFLVFVGAATVGFLNKDSFKMYKILEKPWFAPPAVAFPIVWTILYILMALAAYRIYMKNRSGIKDGGAYFYYLVQLLVNFLWPFLFFSLRLYGISFLVICVLLVLIIITTFKFKSIDKISAILMIPYIIWTSYAAVLNFFIWMYNEM